MIFLNWAMVSKSIFTFFLVYGFELALVRVLLGSAYLNTLVMTSGENLPRILMNLI